LAQEKETELEDKQRRVDDVYMMLSIAQKYSGSRPNTGEYVREASHMRSRETDTETLCCVKVIANSPGRQPKGPDLPGEQIGSRHLERNGIAIAIGNS
jgi:hypothetical protein